ncbi:MAG: plasmid pRiA4b ORF-3 family protein [Thiohalomonadales bacterium]
MPKRIYQFKIALKEITPTIWRRIQVPEGYSFWDLHVAIQDAMGWLDYHLHLFQVRRKHAHRATEIGIPDDSAFEGSPEIHPGWEIPISDYFGDVGVTADYEYDFGDGWCHEILLEGILLSEKGQKYPRCIDGARACPPEDCGGVHGYDRVLEALADPDDEEHESMLEWLGGKYDPQEFVPGKVKFDNPTKRWRGAFSIDQDQ